MKKNKAVILNKQVENDFFALCAAARRYIGGEINQIKKDLTKCDLSIALCFPDIYEVGMSHTGLAIIYDCLNKIPGVAAERVFAHWHDAEDILRKKKYLAFQLGIQSGSK